MEKNVAEPLLESPYTLAIEDETTVRVTTYTKRVIARTGSTPVVKTRLGHYNQRVNVFITYFQNGKVVISLCQGLDSTATKRHLRKVRREHGPGRIILLWDGSGSHYDKEVLNRCSKWGLHPIYFPPHSPELNPVEEINKQLKRQLANRLFWSVEELEQAVLDFFEHRDYHFTLEVANYLT